MCRVHRRCALPLPIDMRGLSSDAYSKRASDWMTGKVAATVGWGREREFWPRCAYEMSTRGHVEVQEGIKFLFQHSLCARSISISSLAQGDKVLAICSVLASAYICFVVVIVPKAQSPPVCLHRRRHHHHPLLRAGLPPVVTKSRQHVSKRNSNYIDG